MTVGGIALGAVLAAAITALLIKVLTGVFDPPPDTAAVPWAYVLALAAVAAGSMAIGGAAAVRAATHGAITRLRDL